MTDGLKRSDFYRNLSTLFGKSPSQLARIWDRPTGRKLTGWRVALTYNSKAWQEAVQAITAHYRGKK